MTEQADGLGEHIIFDVDGVPRGVVDMDLVTDTGTLLAFALTAACQDPAAVDRIIGRILKRFGPEAFAFIAASALSVVARYPLAEAVATVRATKGLRNVETLGGDLDGWRSA